MPRAIASPAAGIARAIATPRCRRRTRARDSRPHPRAALVGVLLVLALTGCGGSHHTTTTTPTHPVATSTSSTSASTAPAGTSPAPGTRPEPPGGGPVPRQFDPVSFTAISSREFWLLGTAPCSNPVCTSIVRTTDGGQHFVGIPAPVAPLAVPGSGATGIDTLRFADALDGFAGPGGASTKPGRLWETHDGGAHWHAGLPGTIAFIASGGQIYALTGTCASSRCSGLRLEHSPASADHWSATPIALSIETSPVTITAHGSSLWISMTPASLNGQHQALAVSGDGGAHVLLGSSPCVPGLGGTLAAASTSVVWAVCPTGTAAGAWRSSDGGGHWQPLHVGSGGGAALGNSATVAPAGDSIALIATGREQEIKRTSDAGTTFSSLVGVPSAGSWSFLGFTDPETASGLLAVAGGPHEPDNEPYRELWRSSDAGVHWQGPVHFG